MFAEIKRVILRKFGGITVLGKKWILRYAQDDKALGWKFEAYG